MTATMVYLFRKKFCFNSFKPSENPLYQGIAEDLPKVCVGGYNKGDN